MHSALRTTLITSLLTVLLGACGHTPPSNYYILRAYEQPPSTGRHISLGIGPIRVPEYLKTNVLATSKGSNRLYVVQENRWAEPLEAGINRVISLNLAGLLKTQDVRTYPWNPKRPPDYALKVRVLELEATPTQANLVIESLIVRSSDGASLDRRMTQFSTPMDNNNADSVASAYSKLFYLFSQDAANTIRGLTQESTLTTP